MVIHLAAAHEEAKIKLCVHCVRMSQADTQPQHVHTPAHPPIIPYAGIGAAMGPVIKVRTHMPTGTV